MSRATRISWNLRFISVCFSPHPAPLVLCSSPNSSAFFGRKFSGGLGFLVAVGEAWQRWYHRGGEDNTQDCGGRHLDNRWITWDFREGFFKGWRWWEMGRWKVDDKNWWVLRFPSVFLFSTDFLQIFETVPNMNASDKWCNLGSSGRSKRTLQMYLILCFQPYNWQKYVQQVL